MKKYRHPKDSLGDVSNAVFDIDVKWKHLGAALRFSAAETLNMSRNL